MKNYEINDDTYAVIGKNLYRSRVIEKYNDYMKLPPKEKRTNHLMRKEEFFYWK